VGYGEGAVRAPALGVDDAFRDEFAVLVGQLLDKLVILEQHGAARTGGQAVLVINDRRAGRSRLVKRAFGGLV
jgi:hypothetical protein